ncbi:Trypsin family protein [Raphanus sativus]|uniref:Protein NARROW LEAF 1 n=1 Tax=Raphanus sativus TaxID=3726 RepID=A0A6J0K100_RAPSA|nr:protein NARROW LEAF 1 [Raphanus sativus]KAJ4891684.1 Trypsin family protein [Raphanus sativus]
MTLGGWFTQAASSQSDDSASDLERNHHCNNHMSLPSSSSPSSLLNPFAFNIQHAESNAPYFSWPTLSRLNNAVEDRANYFANLQKGVLPEIVGRLPSGQQATTLLELMTIRAFHSKILRRFSLGTAVGFRITRGVLTNTPAILVFVARKVHRQWLNPMQCLPSALEGPGGVWCDVDVVEFQYYGAPAATPKEQVYNELVDGLRGSDPCIGSGSQVASQETYRTLGAIVKSRTGNHQVGFLTNRHVAVDLDYPSQKMFHPLPPSLGPGVYLGAVERATSFITDDQWYGIFADTNPETFVRADGAFIPFAEDLSMSNVTTVIKGIGEIGNVHVIDLQSPIDTLIGKQVVKVGRSSGYTTGTVMAYALEYNDEKGICFLTDFLVIGENQQTFDLEGDSGSLILLTSPNGQKPRPVGIIWGGTANRGRLKLIAGQEPENWTSGVDLGRLLDLLELDLITSNHELEAAREQRNTSVTALGSTVCQSSPPDPVPSGGDKQDENFEPFIPPEFHIEEAIKPTPEVEEHVFIAPLSFNESTSSASKEQERLKVDDLVALKSSSEEDEEEVSISLHLGEPKLKKPKFF